ncbi:cytochrome P450 [Xylariaceae sp. FL0255]|nr:cytochrome P450 [Xylariaceae sp. FL0255]
MYTISLLLVAAVSLLLLRQVIIYIWYAKRLRRFPNASKLSGITNLYYIIIRWRGTQSKELNEIHNKHPILRIGPNSLAFFPTAAIRAFYGHSTPCLKAGTYVTAWRIMAQAFAARNLGDWEFKIADKVQRLTDNHNIVVDWYLWSNLFTVEAIADIALSQHLGLFEGGDDVYRHWKFMLDRVPGLFHSQWEKGRHFDEMVAHLTQVRIQRFKRGEILRDFVEFLLRDKEGRNRNLDTRQTTSEVAPLLDAGSDTTAIAPIYLLFNLSKHPSVLDRFRDELDLIISYKGVKCLTYLHAYIDESLRLLPPGLVIDGHWVAGDTFVGVPTYTAYRDFDVFGLDLEMLQASFIAFSAGARGCIWRNITKIEQTVLLATLVSQFDFESVDHSWRLSHEEAFNLWPGPLPWL